MTGFGRQIFLPGSKARVAVSSSSASASVPNGGKNKRYALTCNTDCYVKWGTGAQTASNSSYNLFMPAGWAVVVDLGGANTIAAIQESTSGVLSIHEVLAD